MYIYMCMYTTIQTRLSMVFEWAKVGRKRVNVVLTKCSLSGEFAGICGNLQRNCEFAGICGNLCVC